MGDIVELVLIDVTRPIIKVPHPIHLHGSNFYVVAMERHVDNITLGTFLDSGGGGARRWQDRGKLISTAQKFCFI